MYLGLLHKIKNVCKHSKGTVLEHIPRSVRKNYFPFAGEEECLKKDEREEVVEG